MRNIVIYSILFCVILTGCVTTNTSSKNLTKSKPGITISQKDRWNLMIGKWYGSQPMKGGGIKKELITKAPDGTYVTEFLHINKDGSTKRSIEVGNWGVSGNIYFSIFRGWVKQNKLSPSNPENSYNYDAYNILELTEDKFHYKHVNTGNDYTNKRVSKDFELKIKESR